MTAPPETPFRRLCKGARDRQPECLLFAIVLLAGGYFYNGAAWNQISRLDAILAFVEPGHPEQFSFCIDRFISDPQNGENTGDWSFHDGHYYSNKAPGLALLGVPVYALLYGIERGSGAIPTSPLWTLLNAYLLNLALTVVPVAIGIFLFCLLLERLALSRRAAVGWSLVLYFCTLLFPYSTQLWGHATAAALIVAALYGLSRLDHRGCLGAGLALGGAVLVEYSCALLVLVVLAAAAWRRQWSCLAAVCLGGVPPLVVFMVYHWLCFGGPLTIANLHTNPYFQSPAAAGGLFASISWEALWGLSFSPERGAFFCMPLLLLLSIGVWRPLPTRQLHAVAVVTILLFGLMNLTFNGWHGGAAVGPRYLIPVLPLAILLLVRACDGRWWRPVTGLLAGLSALNMLVLTVVSPMCPLNIAKPLQKFYYGLASGVVNEAGLINPWPRSDLRGADQFAAYSAFNLGEIVGLRWLWSLLPWLLLTAVLGWRLWRSLPGGASPAPNVSPPDCNGSAEGAY